MNKDLQEIWDYLNNLVLIKLLDTEYKPQYKHNVELYKEFLSKGSLHNIESMDDIFIFFADLYRYFFESDEVLLDAILAYHSWKNNYKNKLTY